MTDPIKSRTPPFGRSRAVLLGLCLLLGLVLNPRRAGAEALTEVTLTSAGPDQELPLRSSFYLKGEAGPNVRTVAPVLVRYSRPVWGISPSYGCREVAAALQTRDVDPALFEGKATPQTVSGLWKQPTAAAKGFKGSVSFESLRNAALLVPSPWQRKADEKEFKVLVGGKDFFAAGSYYCLLVYQRSSETKNQAGAVRQKLSEHTAAIAKCASDLTPPVCRTNADRASLAAIKKLAPKLDETWLTTKMFPAGTDAGNARQDVEALATLLDAWLNDSVALPGDSGDSDYASTDEPLAELIARLLAREGKLYPKVEDGGVHFYDESGRLKVNQLGLLDNWSGVRLRQDLDRVDGSKQVALKVDLSKVVIPDTGITVLDLLNLARGKLRLGTTKTDIDSLFIDRLDPAMQGRNGADELGAIVKGLDDWASMFSANATRTHVVLQAWLRSSVLTDCSSPTFAGPLTKAHFAPAGPGGPVVECDIAEVGRLGFAADKNPLEALTSRLADYGRARAQLAELDTKAAVDNLSVSRWADAPLHLKVDMSQKTFVTTYVTLVVGSARFLNVPEPFSTLYTGVQIYLFPNPIDEPMWTNGTSDARRLVGLELGFVPKGARFGPGDRYTTPPKFPITPFVGLSLQPIPYGTISLGRFWAGSRSTALPQQAPQLVGGWYFGASVQANIPDLVRALASGGVNSSTK